MTYLIFSKMISWSSVDQGAPLPEILWTPKASIGRKRMCFIIMYKMTNWSDQAYSSQNDEGITVSFLYTLSLSQQTNLLLWCHIKVIILIIVEYSGYLPYLRRSIHVYCLCKPTWCLFSLFFTRFLYLNWHLMDLRIPKYDVYPIWILPLFTVELSRYYRTIYSITCSCLFHFLLGFFISIDIWNIYFYNVLSI